MSRTGGGGLKEGRGSRGRDMKVVGGQGMTKIDYRGVSDLQISKIRE